MFRIGQPGPEPPHPQRGLPSDPVATASGITKGAFYYHFKSKHALCENVIDQAKTEYQQLVASIDQAAEPIDQLRQFIAKVIQLNISGEWVNCRLILRLSLDNDLEYPETQRKIDDFWQWYAGLYTEMIGNCRAAGQLSTSLPLANQLQILCYY